MSTIKDATKALLAKSDVAGWVLLADKYMHVYVANPKSFVLPSEHEILKPLVVYYARNQKKFPKYILQLRDYYDRKTDARHGELNKLYRRVFGRILQRERRERLDTALGQAEAQYGPCPNFQTRMAWCARREHEWAQERLDVLDSYRAKMSNGKLQRDEFNEVVERFWADIDERIARGDVPPWED